MLSLIVKLALEQILKKRLSASTQFWFKAKNIEFPLSESKHFLFDKSSFIYLYFFASAFSMSFIKNHSLPLMLLIIKNVEEFY